jgi:hypothetical protein
MHVSRCTGLCKQVVLTQPKAMRDSWAPAWAGVYDAEKLLAAVDSVVLPQVRVCWVGVFVVCAIACVVLNVRTASSRCAA